MHGFKPTLRIYLLGGLPSGEAAATLTSLGEFQDARAVIHTPLTAADAQSLAADTRALRGFVESGYPSLEEPALQALGSRLFDLIVHGKVRQLFLSATGLRGKGLLPLEIFIESHDLACWPWEYMYDNENQTFVCREFHPISRGIFDPTPAIESPATYHKLSILIVVGSSNRDTEINFDEERTLLTEIFGTFLARDAFKIDVLGGSRPIDLIAHLQHSPCHIIHFIGHAGFDIGRKEGYLKFSSHTGHEERLYANNLARMLTDRGVRLAFLNACETARSAATIDPARSSIAACLIGRGIPAVIANQFSIPDNGAHFFATVVYNALFAGRPLGDAVLAGRSAICLSEKSKFFDWGIPVLYAKQPQEPVFLLDAATVPIWAADFSSNQPAGRTFELLAREQSPTSPSLTVTPLVPLRKMTAQQATLRTASKLHSVALVDIDARAGFLPRLVESANCIQGYYDFRVVYMPIPAGSIRTEFNGQRTEPQLYLPHLQAHVERATEMLGIKTICFLTCNLIAGSAEGRVFWNFFSAAIDSNPNVFFVSTFDLRRYARESGVSFAKAAFELCLSGVLAADSRWDLQYHEETVGCLFDFCQVRSDIVLSLRKKKFDHMECRHRIRDKKQLYAIDALLAMEVDSTD